MTDIGEYVLKQMYDECLDYIGDKKEPSLLISVLSRNTNKIKRSILSSARSGDSIPQSIIKELSEKEYIREYSPGLYTITARGLLHIEFESSQIELDHYINWLDSHYFLSNDGSISDRNKIVLLAVFSARCFSADSCASYSTDQKENAFLELLYNCQNFLASIGVVKEDSLKSKNAKSKSELSSILGQIDKLPSCTGMKFIASGKNYYLDLVKDDVIDRNIITFFHQTDCLTIRHLGKI